MKKLTSILITLLFAFNVEGQSRLDSLLEKLRESGTVTGNSGLPLTLGGGTISYVSDPWHQNSGTKTDTVMCLMMVTDTARTFFVSHVKVDTVGRDYVISIDSSLCDTIYYEPDLSVKTIIGYSVTTTIGSPFNACLNCYSRTVEYLDDKKQPLSKSIIVWQSINQK